MRSEPPGLTVRDVQLITGKEKWKELKTFISRKNNFGIYMNLIMVIYLFIKI